MPSDKDAISTLRKRWDCAVETHKAWEQRERTKDCYQYWRGNQLKQEFDARGNRKAQVNKIHADVSNTIPSLYFYHPFARVTPCPELADTPGSEIDNQSTLLQDTVNALIRDPHTSYREATDLAFKESFWAFGCVEVGYSATFADDPLSDRPALKEKEKTVIPTELKDEAGELEIDSDDMLRKEVEKLKESLVSEQFYVKHIPANRVMVSGSDMPILGHNDWVGYYEDLPLSDVKEAGKRGVYKNTKSLRAVGCSDEDSDEDQRNYKSYKEKGDVDKVRLFKIWDLRKKEKIVYAEKHDMYLLRKKYKRPQLFFLRFDIDPYHFYPKPPIALKLGPQDEYNQSREYLRLIRIGTVPRYTYDEDGIDPEHLQKLEKGVMGTYVPRHAGTTNVIEPINQPSFSENAIQTLTLSDKEFADVGGVGGDAKVSQTKTATQAKIAEVKEQSQENFDRVILATWLGEIAKELLMLAIDNMLMDRWVKMNVAADSLYAPQEIQSVMDRYRMVTGEALARAADGQEFNVIVDIESMSPVTQEEKFQKWMQGLQFIANPQTARVFAVMPELLEETLTLMGMQSARRKEMIKTGMQKLLEIEMQRAAMGQDSGPGVSPMGGGGQPGTPKPPGEPSPATKQGTPGGPQPGGPAGPGASVPK